MYPFILQLPLHLERMQRHWCADQSQAVLAAGDVRRPITALDGNIEDEALRAVEFIVMM